MTRRHYSKAPITEAVIDLRVQLPAGTALLQLDPVVSAMLVSYPIKRTLQELEANVRVDVQAEGNPQLTGAAKSNPHGYILTSVDGRNVMQIRLDGIALSRLHPYDCWEALRDEAKRIWTEYRTTLSPQRVLRVGLRYINKLELPLPLDDFGRFLRTMPTVSPELPQALSQYFMRLEVPLSGSNALAIITQAILPKEREEVVPIVLDIDVIRTKGLPSKDDDLWAAVEILHTEENRVFEGCITDDLRSLIA